MYVCSGIIALSFRSISDLFPASRYTYLQHILFRAELLWNNLQKHAFNAIYAKYQRTKYYVKYFT